MLQFSPNNPDHVLLAQDLWNKLKESGDLDGMFMEGQATTAYQIMGLMSDPNYGFLDVDEKGVWMAVWFSSWMNSAWMGLWVREDKRHSMSFHKNLFPLLRGAFKLVPVIMGVTKKPEILEIHRKLGYDISIVVPNLYGDKPGWIVQLHRDQFKFLKKKQKAVLEVA